MARAFVALCANAWLVSSPPHLTSDDGRLCTPVCLPVSATLSLSALSEWPCCAGDCFPISSPAVREHVQRTVETFSVACPCRSPAFRPQFGMGRGGAKTANSLSLPLSLSLSLSGFASQATILMTIAERKGFTAGQDAVVKLARMWRAYCYACMCVRARARVWPGLGGRERRGK
jgi:hypothetical protein